MSLHKPPLTPLATVPEAALDADMPRAALSAPRFDGHAHRRALLQRLLSLLAAFALLALFLSCVPTLCRPLLQDTPDAQNDWTQSWRAHDISVAQALQFRLAPTLLLVVASLGLALILGLIAAAVAVLLHRLEPATPILAAFGKAGGRLLLYGIATVPVAMLSVLLIACLLPIAPNILVRVTGYSGHLSELLAGLAVPALLLALLPALLTGQAVACAVTQAAGDVRRGVLLGAAVVLEQIGGVLGASVVIEQQFAWPGLGNLFVSTLSMRDYPMVLGLVWIYAGIVLVARLLATFLRWSLTRWMAQSAQLSSESVWHTKGRVLWAFGGVALLSVPLLLALAGLRVGSEAPLRITDNATFQTPSAQFPWGTDMLGRDVRARVLRGSFNTLGASALLGLAMLPLVLGGWAIVTSLTARFPRQGRWIRTALRLPHDVLLFIPALVLVASLRLIGLADGSPGWSSLLLMLGVAVSARAFSAFEALLGGRPHTARVMMGASVALVLTSLFSIFWLVILLEEIGLTIWPPAAPELGWLFVDAMAAMRSRPELLLLIVALTSICSFCLYTAADALIGFFHTKQVMARFNL